MRLVVLLLTASFLISCESEKARRDRELNEAEARVQRSTENVARAEARLRSIDDELGWLTTAQAEDPAKTDRLLRQCMASTGETMEGEGALRLARCIRDRW